MKTKKLKYEPQFTFQLIGITTTEDDYKISWIINNCLGIELIKDNNLSIKSQKHSIEQSFSLYKAHLPITEDEIKLISNKSSQGYLIEELKNIDFFLIIFSDKNNKIINELIKKLNSKETISIALKIDANKLKSKEKLLF